MTNKSKAREVKGKNNPNYKDGNRMTGNYPCPQCGKDRTCEKRNAYRICLDCFRDREGKFVWTEWREKVQKESKKFAMKYKGGKCEVCGVSDLPSCCYHFHHKDSKEKKFMLGLKFNQKISDKIIKELDKCFLLCANCHAIIHHNRELLSLEVLLSLWK